MTRLKIIGIQGYPIRSALFPAEAGVAGSAVIIVERVRLSEPCPLYSGEASILTQERRIETVLTALEAAGHIDRQGTTP